VRTSLVATITLLVFAALAAPPAAAAADMAVYSDALQNGFQDWSWATHSLTNATPVHAGTYSIRMVPYDWQGVYLHRDAAVSGLDYSALDFYVHGGTAGGQSLYVVLQSGGSAVGSWPLTTFLPGGPVANAWSLVHVDLDAVGLGAATFNEVVLQSGSAATQPAVYFDDIVLIGRTGGGGGAAVAVAVSPDLDRHAVSPNIFGVSRMDAAPTGSLVYPFRRWGGNSTTRYSWEDDADNRGSDWFFFNIPGSGGPSDSAADRFLDDCRARGEEPLLTVPLIGWTARDRVKRWSFSIAKYGPQSNNECLEADWASWCEEDAGNGMHTDGVTPVTGNDPYDTSRPVTSSFVTGWMAHIASRIGTAGQGGLKYYALDNEPMLWNSTHRDVHPAPVDYAEIWQRTQEYAAAIKGQDPNAVTFGPVLWGWCAYFYSAADGCAAGADYNAHGPFLEWYFSQVEAYRQSHGVRLVDVLDIHYYPQATGVALSDDETGGTAALRLRSLRSLYDPTYVDESWIGTQVRLIPRMKALIAAKAPGTKLAITEYNWGNDTGLSSALAQVEVLGIFAREGVDYANRWVAPAVGSRVEDAFRLYLNYDGAGSRVWGDSARAVSAAVDDVGSYALESPDGRLYLVLVNKATAARDAQVTVTGGLRGDVALYGFEGTAAYGTRGTVTPSSGAFTVPLPARSARLAVVCLDREPFGSVPNLRLAKTTGGNQRLTWDAVTGAADYVVREDPSPSGPFSTVSGTATSGATGLTLPATVGLRYYLVAARGACGAGPIR